MTDKAEHEHRGEEGRAALFAMLKGFSDVTVTLAALTGRVGELTRQTALLVDQNAELVRILGELLATQRLTVEYSAALQQQIGVLVQVQARQTGVTVRQAPPFPTPSFAPGVDPSDPIGNLGRAAVNGVLNHLHGRRGGRGGAPPGY